MIISNNYFSEIKVGDKVESLEFGEGSLLKVHIPYELVDPEFCLECQFKNEKHDFVNKYFLYNLEGKRYRQDYQTLFYPGVKVIAPKV